MGDPPCTPDTDVEQLGKLRWRCRRGMKELDVLLTRYVNERLPGTSKAERDLFDELLQAQDPVLYAYCLKSTPPPPRFAALIERITENSPARG